MSIRVARFIFLVVWLSSMTVIDFGGKGSLVLINVECRMSIIRKRGSVVVSFGNPANLCRIGLSSRSVLKRSCSLLAGDVLLLALELCLRTSICAESCLADLFDVADCADGCGPDVPTNGLEKFLPGNRDQQSFLRCV